MKVRWARMVRVEEISEACGREGACGVHEVSPLADEPTPRRAPRSCVEEPVLHGEFQG